MEEKKVAPCLGAEIISDSRSDFEKLFDSTYWEQKGALSDITDNEKYFRNFIIENDRFYYKEGYISDHDVLHYIEQDSKGVKAIPMRDLIVYAIGEQSFNDVLYFISISTGEIYSLIASYYPDEEDDILLAFKESERLHLLAGRPNITMYNSQEIKAKTRKAKISRLFE
ncbi:hypothetical protein C8N40_110125 [Pontibacter mucosus]|uniref:Uncharacterized protein n=1 Tax=Pontibacter mucosus TaxID=1649266 RepID=A0A2T5YDS7_9BACT|nr:hypothetical protein [Pontibacter mucosus]PTX14696.1 hypothetical protein C8N40_110125 [Pontibacter mucosus]